MALIEEILRTLFSTSTDVLPVGLFMLFFYRVVLGQTLANRASVLAGFGFVIVGLALLLLGVDKALFPVGRLMVEQLTAGSAVDGADTPAHWATYYPVYVFAFCIAFGAALAEPALLAVSLKVDDISGGAIRSGGLRMVAAFGVASGVMLGCLRIAAGIPLHWCLAAVYLIIIVQTVFAPRQIVPLAYDSGGVSTTVVTVPVVTALGLGLAEQLPGRSPLLDGFGLIALACAVPAITVLAYAQISWLLERRASRHDDAVARSDAGDKEG
jgi:hypothetical protein